MSSNLRTFFMATAALGWVACSTDGDTPDTANVVPDLGFADSGVLDPDTGITPDGGEVPDSGESDTGVGPTCPAPFVPSGAAPTCAPVGTDLGAETAPIRRGDVAQALDPACGRIFMFYGDRAEPLMCNPAASVFIDDGYMFEPKTGHWYQLAPTGPAPLNRVRSSAIWDPTGNRVVIFGGRYRAGTSGPYTFMRDVWAFDPATQTWTELWNQNGAPGPSGRMNTLAVADPASNRMLVFAGGQVAADQLSFLVNNQTWAFDFASNTWSQLTTTGTPPTARLFHTGAFDTNTRTLYAFGGGGADAFTSPTFFDDLWALDVVSRAWRQITPAGEGPAGRIKAEMDFDATRNRLVLFGGHDDTNLGNTNDIWSFDIAAQTWSRQIEGDTFNAPATDICDFPADFALVDQCSPERRESHVFRIMGDEAIMHGGRTDCGLSNDTWILNLLDHTWRQVNGSFTGMTCHRSGRSDCNNPGAKKCG